MRAFGFIFFFPKLYIAVQTFSALLFCSVRDRIPSDARNHGERETAFPLLEYFRSCALGDVLAVVKSRYLPIDSFLFFDNRRKGRPLFFVFRDTCC